MSILYCCVICYTYYEHCLHWIPNEFELSAAFSHYPIFPSFNFVIVDLSIWDSGILISLMTVSST